MKEVIAAMATEEKVRPWALPLSLLLRSEPGAKALVQATTKDWNEWRR